MQIGALRLQLHCLGEFSTRGFQIAAEAGGPSQSSVNISILRSETNRSPRLRFGRRQVTTSGKSVGQIHVRVGEIWLQAQSNPELRNTVRDVFLREKHPSEKIVTLGVTGFELHNLFECCPRVHEVAALQGRQTLAI